MGRMKSRMLGPLSFQMRLALFYAAMFLAAGIKLTYLPLWLDGRGLTAPEIAVVAGAPLFLRIVAAPVITAIADRIGDHRRVLIGLAWAAALLVMMLGGARGFVPILLLALLAATASTAIIPLTEVIAMAGVRRAGADYGRMRLWGSLSFVAASFAAGLGIERVGVGSVIVMLAVASVLAALVAHGLPGAQAGDGAGPAAAPAAGNASMAGGVRRLLGAPWFVVFLIAVGAVQSSHALFYTFGVLLWRDQGITPLMASGLWTVGVAAEVALFACSGMVVRAVGARLLIVTGAVAGLVRWLAMALDPPFAALVGLQVLHGLTYGAAHLGAVHFISQTVPETDAGAAQGLYASATSGIAMGLATLLAGALYPGLQGRAYLAMAALTGVGLLASVLLARTGDAAKA